MGAIRNPEGHRDQQLKLEDAIGQILTISMLLRKLKQDFRTSFRKKSPQTVRARKTKKRFLTARKAERHGERTNPDVHR